MTACKGIQDVQSIVNCGAAWYQQTLGMGFGDDLRSSRSSSRDVAFCIGAHKAHASGRLGGCHLQTLRQSALR